MGASLPTLNPLTGCGTPSSRTRKLPRGILGMKRPLLSSTATSTWTVFTSLLNVGSPSGVALSLVENLEGIFGWSASFGTSFPLASFFLGLATVSEESGFGPCWAARYMAPATKDTAASMAVDFNAFIGSRSELYQKRRRNALGNRFPGAESFHFRPGAHRPPPTSHLRCATRRRPTSASHRRARRPC